MKKRSLRAGLSLLLAISVLFSAVVSVSALSDVYRFDEFGMSVKVPKNYLVITRSTPAEDPVFASLGRDYQDVMSDFRTADIYLRAYDPDGVFQLSLMVTQDEQSDTIGSYADLSDVERREILDTLLLSVPSAKEVTRGEYIFFDSSRESSIGDEPLYINQCSTIVNGLQIDLTLTKSGEPIVSSEAKTLIATASSIEFDKVETSASGPQFDWWRLLLWGGLLAVLTIGLSILSHHRNEVRRRRLEERHRKRLQAADLASEPDAAEAAGAEVAFDEALGYSDGDRFSERVGADLESIDISVREKDPDRGVSYFEDGGKSIDDRSEDYFEKYFKEPTPARSGISRLFSTVGAYIAIAFRHIGYFFRNLLGGIRRRKKEE